MFFFDIENVAFQIMGYPISYVELIGTLFGLVSIYFATRANILTWSSGIINELFLFILFFQVQLYADMFLQVYFFIVTIYGWYKWKSKKDEVDISVVDLRTRIILIFFIICLTLIFGFLFSNIHNYLPRYFKIKASFPFMDSFVMVLSIVATVLLAKKKIENWYLWIFVDLVCVFLYYKKAIYFLSLEYLIFLGLASYGYYHWKKRLSND